MASLSELVGKYQQQTEDCPKNELKGDSEPSPQAHRLWESLTQF